MIEEKIPDPPKPAHAIVAENLNNWMPLLAPVMVVVCAAFTFAITAGAFNAKVEHCTLREIVRYGYESDFSFSETPLPEDSERQTNRYFIEYVEEDGDIASTTVGAWLVKHNVSPDRVGQVRLDRRWHSTLYTIYVEE